MVDAILQGALPVARDLGVGLGEGELFRHNDNCLTIPWDYTPKEFGHLVTEYAYLSYDEHTRILERGVDLLPLFDRRIIAQFFIDLSKGYKDQIGTLDPIVALKSYTALQEFFYAK
jgi:hypothetical protein